MQEVRLDLATYDELQDSVRTKTARIDALEHELAKMKKNHEYEIETMSKEGSLHKFQEAFSFPIYSF